MLKVWSYRFQEVVLHPGRIECFFLDHVKKYSSIEVERGVLRESLSLDESKVDDPNSYPITVTLWRLTDAEASPAQSNSHSLGGEAPPDGLFRSNLAADDTDDLFSKE